MKHVSCIKIKSTLMAQNFEVMSDKSDLEKIENQWPQSRDYVVEQ
jgi:hypothetical protein